MKVGTGTFKCTHLLQYLLPWLSSVMIIMCITWGGGGGGRIYIVKVIAMHTLHVTIRSI